MMYHATSLQVAITSLVFVQVVLGNPIALKRNAPGLQMWPATITDMRDGTTEPHNASINNAVSARDLAARGFPRWQDIKCGALGGSQDSYDEGKKRFQTWSKGAGSTVVQAIKYELQDYICNNHQVCDLAIEAAVSAGGILGAVSSTVEHFFDDGFDAIRAHCGSSGGSSNLIVDIRPSVNVCGKPTCTAEGKMGLRVATLGAQYYVHDGGDTCPADTAQSICKIERF
ncbi:hypothetical protein Micbo1qcDRAFT_203878 [Microdochium bolleyi]|uniref:Uncharacterized protein n=1 Tax=Microdochium bolleyi TaxID=196109 RepID=A0A136J3L1_9PEZI|nr:hypothetical protein Micbo1qcDRAFT_203878 [Microdochium bolleyi]